MLCLQQVSTFGASALALEEVDFGYRTRKELYIMLDFATLICMMFRLSLTGSRFAEARGWLRIWLKMQATISGFWQTLLLLFKTSSSFPHPIVRS